MFWYRDATNMAIQACLVKRFGCCFVDDEPDNDYTHKNLFCICISPIFNCNAHFLLPVNPWVDRCICEPIEDSQRVAFVSLK